MSEEVDKEEIREEIENFLERREQIKEIMEQIEGMK